MKYKKRVIFIGLLVLATIFSLSIGPKHIRLPSSTSRPTTESNKKTHELKPTVKFALNNKSEQPECEALEAHLAQKSNLEHFKDLVKGEAPADIDEIIVEVLEVEYGLGLRADSSPIARLYYVNGIGINREYDDWEELEFNRIKILEDLAKGSSNAAYHLHLAFAKLVVQNDLPELASDKEIFIHIEDAMKAPNYDLHDSSLKKRIFELGMKSPDKLMIASRLLYSAMPYRGDPNIISNYSNLIFDLHIKNPELINRYFKYSEKLMKKMLVRQNEPNEYFPLFQYELINAPYRSFINNSSDDDKLRNQMEIDFPHPYSIPGQRIQDEQLGHHSSPCTPVEIKSAWLKRKAYFKM